MEDQAAAYATGSETQPTPNLVAECDRICGVTSAYHKDRCPLYKANCQAMDAWNVKEAPRGRRS